MLRSDSKEELAVNAAPVVSEIHAAENKLARDIINYLSGDITTLTIDNQYFTDRQKDDNDYAYIKNLIETNLKHAPNLKNAALILFKLVMKIALNQQNLAASHVDILHAMKKDELTLDHMNKIFVYLSGRDELVKINNQTDAAPAAPAPAVSTQKTGLFAIAGSYTSGIRHYATTTLATALGGLYSQEWQHTMSTSRHFALQKLVREKDAQDGLHEKIRLLENARTMQIFTEHQSNSVLTGAYGNTNAVNTINGMLQVLRNEQVLSTSMRK